MSIWATIFDLEDDPPYTYRGSHVLPCEDDPRVDADMAVSLAQIPSHITREGRDDRPEDGALPWLRVSVGIEDQVLHRPQVEELYRVLGAWLEQTGGGHTYLSTGCLHGEHGYCQSYTGLSGAKAPARCKFCGAACVCPCHKEVAR